MMPDADKAAVLWKIGQKLGAPKTLAEGGVMMGCPMGAFRHECCNEAERLREENAQLRQRVQELEEMYASLGRNYDSLEKRAEAAEAKLARLARCVEALEAISAIKNKTTGGDWDEIEMARQIARAALAAVKGE